MSSAWHPSLGRPLADCIEECKLAGSIASQPTVSRNQVLTAIKKIFVDDLVSIQDLKTVLCAPRTPLLLELLSSCRALARCGMILNRLHGPELLSCLPFHWEHGFLALRLYCLSLGLNMLRLSGPNDLNAVKSFIAVNPEARYPNLPNMVAQVLSQKIEQGDPACDALLGWVNGRTDERGSLVNETTALIILCNLSEGIRAVMAAGSQGLPEGLEPLMFMFWRLAETKNTDFMWVNIYELLQRISLGIPMDNHLVFYHILYRLNSAIIPWARAKQKWIPEDTIDVMQMFEDRLSPRLNLYNPPRIEYLLSIMIFPLNCLQPHNCFLVSQFIRATLTYCWALTDVDGGKWVQEEDALGRIIYQLMAAIYLLKKFKRLDEHIKSLRMLGKCNFISMLGRGILTLELDPVSVTPTREEEEMGFMRNLERIMVLIELSGIRVAAQSFYLELPDWIHTLRQLEMRLSKSSIDDPLRHGHIKNQQIWLKLGKISGFDILSRSFGDFECMYARCPDPQMGGAYLCDEEDAPERYYCSIRCQRMDWPNHPHECYDSASASDSE